MTSHQMSPNVTICHEMSPCLIEILVRTWNGGIWQHVMTYHDVVKLINSERYCGAIYDGETQRSRVWGLRQDRWY